MALFNFGGRSNRLTHSNETTRRAMQLVNARNLLALPSRNTIAQTRRPITPLVANQIHPK